jgi:hypothetical protein
MSRPDLVPTLRILDPEAAEEVAHNRQAWAELWQTMARETDAANEAPPDDEETAAERTPALVGSRPAFADEEYLT